MQGAAAEVAWAVSDKLEQHGVRSVVAQIHRSLVGHHNGILVAEPAKRIALNWSRNGVRWVADFYDVAIPIRVGVLAPKIAGQLLNFRMQAVVRVVPIHCVVKVQLLGTKWCVPGAERSEAVHPGALHSSEVHHGSPLDSPAGAAVVEL